MSEPYGHEPEEQEKRTDRALILAMLVFIGMGLFMMATWPKWS